MKPLCAAILNVPWAIAGLLGALLSGPYRVSFSSKPFAVIFYVRGFWWWKWLPGQHGIRAMANAWCIQIGPQADKADVKHELIHAGQAERQPLIHPILYWIETKRCGYRANAYEEEAYRLSGSRYLGK